MFAKVIKKTTENGRIYYLTVYPVDSGKNHTEYLNICNAYDARDEFNKQATAELKAKIGGYKEKWFERE
jgi:hypothetical protein